MRVMLPVGARYVVCFQYTLNGGFIRGGQHGEFMNVAVCFAQRDSTSDIERLVMLMVRALRREKKATTQQGTSQTKSGHEMEKTGDER